MDARHEGVVPVIRPAKEQDVGLILSFIKELAEYERLSHEVIATEELLKGWLFGPKRKAEVVIAEYDGLPVGFSLFFHSFSSFLGRPGIYIEDIYVQPTARGKGVGRALLAHVAGLAHEKGYGRVEWAVLNWNEPAIGFYNGVGAQPMSEWTVYRLSGAGLENVAQKG